MATTENKQHDLMLPYESLRLYVLSVIHSGNKPMCVKRCADASVRVQDFVRTGTDSRSKIGKICGRGLTRILFRDECIFPNNC